MPLLHRPVLLSASVWMSRFWQWIQSIYTYFCSGRGSTTHHRPIKYKNDKTGVSATWFHVAHHRLAKAYMQIQGMGERVTSSIQCTATAHKKNWSQNFWEKRGWAAKTIEVYSHAIVFCDRVILLNPYSNGNIEFKWWAVVLFYSI